MRKIIPLILSLFMILMLTACSSNSNEPSIGENTQTSSSGQTNRPAEPKPDDTGKKVLVTYFPATGTTKALAEYAADAVNGDLYEIVPKEPCTSVEHILRYIARTTE